MAYLLLIGLYVLLNSIYLIPRPLVTSISLCLHEFSLLNREGDGTQLQYSCLENPMDGGAWWAAVRGVARSQAQLGDFTFHFHVLEKEMATHSSVLAWRT